MKDLMIDIETLGTSNNAVVTQIGACYFDRYSGEVGDKFLANVQIQDCLNLGLEVDAGAIKFWLEQTGRTFLDNPQPLSKAIQQLRDFYNKDTLVWSHLSFDAIIIANCCKVLKQGNIFPYRNLRDIRTLVDLSNIPYKKGKETTHNALEDCIYQVSYCCESFKNLKGV